MSRALLTWEESWRLLAERGGELPDPWPEDPGECNTPTPDSIYHRPILRDRRFDEIDFTGLRLQRVLFLNCNFHAVSFAGSDLRQCYFVGDLVDCDLSGVVLTCADLRRARFFGCRLVNAVFIGCECRGTAWDHCDLTGVNFTGARLDRSLKEALPLSDAQRRVQIDWRLPTDRGPDEHGDEDEPEEA